MLDKQEMLKREALHFDKFVLKRSRSNLLIPPSALESKRVKNIIKILGNIAGKRILDIGCGTGFHSCVLGKLGADVLGIDISGGSMKIAQERARLNSLENNVNFIQDDIFDFFQKRGSNYKHFDIVFGAFILHHITRSDLEDLGKLIYEALSPKGMGLFIENSQNNPLIMFIRNYLVGHFGIPKLGYPLD